MSARNMFLPAVVNEGLGVGLVVEGVLVSCPHKNQMQDQQRMRGQYLGTRKDQTTRKKIEKNQW